MLPGELLTEAQLDEALEAVERMDPRDALVLAMAAIVHAKKCGKFLDPRIQQAVEAADPFMQALVESTQGE